MLELGLKVLLAYFLGSLMGGIVMGRLYGGVDLGSVGSGNIGGTNALRTQGKLFALGVVIIDIGKGAVAAGVIPALALPGVAEHPMVDRQWLALCCAGAAVAGHVFPQWHHFRGGKGAATLVGAIAVLAPALLIPLVVIWVGVIAFTGFVGLATMVTAWSAPVFIGLAWLPDAMPLLIFSVVMATFIVFTHRSNIARMRAGNENRNERLMLFRRRG